MTNSVKNVVRYDVEYFSNNLGFEYVEIDDEAIYEYADEYSTEEFELPDWMLPFHPDPDADVDHVIDFYIVGNALNYCFNYPDGRSFAVEYDDIEFSGSGGLWAALKRAVEDDGPDPLDPDVLATVSREQVEEWFRPSNGVRIPFLAEEDAGHTRDTRTRLELLRSIGQDLPDEYDSFAEGVRDRTRFFGGVDNGVVNWLVETFDAYTDVRWLDEEHGFTFNKRAQLAAAMIYARLQDEDVADYPDADLLTVYADYSVPAVLRALGLIEYDDILAKRVNTGQPIESDSRMEIEIRAATVLAGDRLVEAINARRDDPITAAEIDFHLFKQRTDMEVYKHYTATDAY